MVGFSYVRHKFLSKKAEPQKYAWYSMGCGKYFFVRKTSDAQAKEMLEKLCFLVIIIGYVHAELKATTTGTR